MKIILLLLFAIIVSCLRAGEIQRITTPGNGIQPRALVAADGTLHLIWYQGSEIGGDVWHATRIEGSTFSTPVRVNSEPGTAIAMGTIRGAQAALGKDGQIHLVWNGAGKRKGEQSPLYYARSTDGGKSFEAQHPMSGTWIMDGGGAVAADSAGRVFVFYHGAPGGNKSPHAMGEEARKVLVRVSNDNGKTFDAERIISPENTGVCGCCAMQAVATDDGGVTALYRTASESGSNRDIAALVSRDGGKTFSHSIIDRWKISTCPMSSISLVKSKNDVIAAWEHDGQVIVAPSVGGKFLNSVSPDGPPSQRKHPVLAVNDDQVLVAWTEGTGWQKGGSMKWQILEGGALKPSSEQGRADGVKVWSFVSVASTKDGFVIVQ